MLALPCRRVQNRASRGNIPRMRAERLAFTDVGRWDVEQCDVPDGALGPHEVIASSRLSLLSPGTELAIFTRHHRGFEVPDHWARYPWFPGYATVAEVTAAGEKSRVREGSLVFHR